MHPSISGQSGQRLFMAAFNLGSVLVYNAPSLGKKVPGFDNNLYEPIGVTVDAQGTLYVADFGYQDVEIFKGGAKAPSQVISVCPGLGNGPIDIALTSNRGLLVSCQLGDILVFAAGATKANEKLTFPGQGAVYGVTLDKNNNVYATGGTASIGLLPCDGRNLSGARNQART